MPRRFTIFLDNDRTFSCQLQSVRCVSNKLNGERCKNKTVIGTPRCWRHLLKENRVRIKETEQHGLGLFAMDPNNINGNHRVFKTNDVIVKYDGEIISFDERNTRYENKTAPYAVLMNDGTINDGACRRGVGSLINHAPQGQANARFSFSRNENELQIKAIKNIRNGSEIRINYNAGKGPRYNFNVEHYTK